jgi:hypothetical protein
MPPTAKLLSRPNDFLEVVSGGEPIQSLGGIGRGLLAIATRTERSQIIISINSRAMPIVPEKFYGVVTNCLDSL